MYNYWYPLPVGILAPYRNQGLASHLLSNLLSSLQTPPSSFIDNLPVSTKSLTKEKKALAAKPVERKKITGVDVHVWTGNEEGRAWYEKRGFTVKDTVEDYYVGFVTFDATA